MKKKIEFDANVRTGTKATFYPVCWIPVPDDLYEQIPTHLVDSQCESVERFHVTLSPVEDPESFVPQDKPDYKAMWETAKEYYEEKRHVWSATDRVADKLLEIEAKYTPQAGVKKEE